MIEERVCVWVTDRHANPLQAQADEARANAAIERAWKQLGPLVPGPEDPGNRPQ
ncbi:hypothetical protein GCM10022205_36680 [Spinactinospora alkalitolerans]